MKLSGTQRIQSRAWSRLETCRYWERRLRTGCEAFPPVSEHAATWRMVSELVVVALARKRNHARVLARL
jgi:hypothetical protein